MESKSLLGSIFEAENQCAEGCIKMLYKLSTLSATTTRLPVIGISLVGSYFNIYIATTARVDQPFPEYQIQRLWVGDVNPLMAVFAVSDYTLEVETVDMSDCF